MNSEGTAFDSFNAYLGERPDNGKIRRIAETVNETNTELRRLAESSDDAARRVARIVLHIRIDGYDAMLQKGLSDSSPVIRCDTIRLSGTGGDRTRFYNHLIKLIREDPDARVRKAAGERLSSTFADLYSLDFQGLPSLSRMLILDSLDGTARSDEERAIEILLSSTHEASFRAARRLLKWKTLERLFAAGGPVALKVLERCAELGVADYLDSLTIDKNQRGWAVYLAGKAGREDIIRRIADASNSQPDTESAKIPDAADTERLFWKIHGCSRKNRDELLNRLPFGDKAFQKSIETAFPPPDRDASSALLFEMAKRGHWTHWAARCCDALLSPDPDIRASAALALSLLSPREAALSLPPLLMDPVARVRNTAAQCLSQLPSHPEGEKITTAAPPKQEQPRS